MPTNEERREVAENLRTMTMCGCRYAEEFYELLSETVMNVGDFHSFNDVADRLADLIEPEPERTCRIRQHRCTNCDHEINNKAYFVKIELGDGIWTVGSRTANYCPNCGCHIKEEPDAD